MPSRRPTFRPIVLGALALTACTQAPHAVKWVDAAPGVTDVAQVVRATEVQARRDRRKLVVYVGAHWCEPCQAIHAAAAHGELDHAFPELEVLAFDLDRDADALERAGYGSRLIPLFVVPEADGRAGPRRTEGGLKVGDNVAYLSRKLHVLLGE